MASTTLDPGRSITSHEAVAARYADVDHEYATTRDLRLMGFVLFLISDCVFFSSFIFSYLYLRTAAPVWPPLVDGKQLPYLDVSFAAVNSVVLFGSGVTMHYALESWKQLKKATFNIWMVATIVLGICFLLGQAHEYSGALQTMSWTGSPFGATFYTPNRDARLSRLHRRDLPDDLTHPGKQRGLYRLQILRFDCGDAVLALRRRHLGCTVLPVLFMVTNYEC